MRRAGRRSLLALTAALTLSGCGGQVAVQDWPTSELRTGGTLPAVELAPEEVHRYRLPLEAGSLLRLEVDQQGIDVELSLEGPDGSSLLQVDRPIGPGGLELVLAVTERAGDHQLVARGAAGGEPGRYQARIEALRPAGDDDRRNAQAYRRFTAAERSEPKEADRATNEREQALRIWRELGEEALAGEALNRLARAHNDQGRRREATELYTQAAAIFARLGDARWEAISRVGAGAQLLRQGEAEQALEQYALALPLAHQVGDRLTAASALQGLGQAHQTLGEPQTALDRYQEALDLLPEGERLLRALALHSMGVIHARFLHDEARGRELLLSARDAWPDGWERYKAPTLSQLGRLAFEQGDLPDARQHFEQALALRRKQDPCGSAVYLARLALVEDAERDRPAAEASLAEALATVSAQGCPRSEPTVYLLAGELAVRQGEPAGARRQYQRCAELFLAQGDRLGAAECLVGTSQAARAGGDRAAALLASRRAIEIVEGVRPTVLREDLRTSFFSGAKAAYDTRVDLLLEAGEEEDAWVVAEQARARVLRDQLAEAGAGLRQAADAGLVEREQQLQRRLNALETQRLGTSERSADKLRTLGEQIDAGVTELETVRGELRRASPRYAALADTEAGPSASLRRDLLDADTLLLELRLGEAGSTLFAVHHDGVEAFPLPPGKELEELARQASSWIQGLEWPGRHPEVLCQLARALLAPVAAQLETKRLVIVPDGGLETLSFAALPDPRATDCPTAPALVDSHEIVYLPSASTLAAQRRLLAGRQPAPGWLAVLADPVYSPNDPRVTAVLGPAAESTTRGRTAPVWRRLPRSADEAAAIAAGVPASRARVALGFEASRQTVLGGALTGYRILHFATHGLLDAERPLLSSLALSQLDERGQPVEGGLAAHEIYDLDLPAELVVLSACETALGRQVAGEGLVSGLPRAFLYAGAARVVVSLWAVEDHSTRDLMERFYRGLLRERQPPGLALAEAQRSLLREGRPPAQWAGFVLLGDWRPLPPFSP
ncbi:MAG TPA: CHAT domain-containing protein [Thermoanaerobaculia bacterium]|nr:CHAT domain-containing protein [Thermoanaerobaculia bacterium]